MASRMGLIGCLVIVVALLNQVTIASVEYEPFSLTITPNDPNTAGPSGAVVGTPPGEGALLASLAKTIESLVHKFDTPPLILSPPQSPSKSLASANRQEGSAKTHPAIHLPILSLPKPPVDEGWQTTLRKQLLAQAE
ncbi:hypothetical protein CJ030_MR0G024282 [Morella rubra]|uniref:Uncharacterized protein n=1 Tax=Morella rubra TaxID=262757 RepID=A0A6A1UGI1_9ROSI|nr:hypothetical protein CJ030_MR0G024282 [Morella rubra]